MFPHTVAADPERDQTTQEETKQDEKPQKEPTQVDGIVDMPGEDELTVPFVVVNSAGELEQQLGFGLKVKEPKGYSERAFYGIYQG